MFFYGRSDVGLRRSVNQDRFLCINVWGGEATLLVVCDGMGGHKAGEIASQQAINTFATRIIENPCFEHNREKQKDAICKQMTLAANSANTLVYEMSKRYEELSGMGTTLVAALICGGFLYIINVGDSRAYIVTRYEAKQATNDHSFVQYLLRENKITPEEAKNYPHKNVITRAIGISQKLEVDFFHADLSSWGTGYILLCSDGLTNYAENADLVRIIGRNSPSGRISDETELIRKTEDLISFANKAGGGDNITAVLAKF